MSFLDDESSAQDGAPREFYKIEVNPPIGDTYLIASGIRDLQVGPLLYTADAVARGETVVPKAGTESELELTLRINHPLVRRYFQQGIPPRKITVTAFCKQLVSGEVETIWIGDVTSVACDAEVAKLRIPSRATETMQRTLPTVTAGRTCPHLLYDAMCAIDREGSSPDAVPFKASTTIMMVNGRDVRVNLSSVPAGDAFRADWTVGGEIVHLATGERMSIRAQTDLNPGISTVCDLSLQMQIVGLKLGDAVEIYAGCNHTIEQCQGKFGNRQRFGGFNRLPQRNVFLVWTSRLGGVSVGEV